MSCQSATYFARSFFTRTFVYTLGSAIFRNTSERLLCIFFSLTGMCQAGIYLFVSLFLRKIRRPVLVSNKLELGICLIILDVSLNFSQFSDHSSSFREVYSLTCVEIQLRKSKKALHANLIKVALYHRYFSKILISSEEQC